MRTRLRPTKDTVSDDAAADGPHSPRPPLAQKTDTVVMDLDSLSSLELGLDSFSGGMAKVTC